MLVWFDNEELGRIGSELFVNHYLFPHELERFGSKFVGAYILDMILVRDKENNTQTAPDGLLSVSDSSNDDDNNNDQQQMKLTRVTNMNTYLSPLILS